mmetsp:Transcript_96924/g.202527  ORF Transcript_96924/g.202527 Transcript_96924/m.202527 type:complete len:271 (+) Transcript_96924:679-1491(+)
MRRGKCIAIPEVSFLPFQRATAHGTIRACHHLASEGDILYAPIFAFASHQSLWWKAPQPLSCSPLKIPSAVVTAKVIDQRLQVVLDLNLQAAQSSMRGNVLPIICLLVDQGVQRCYAGLSQRLRVGFPQQASRCQVERRILRLRLEHVDETFDAIFFEHYLCLDVVVRALSHRANFWTFVPRGHFAQSLEVSRCENLCPEAFHSSERTRANIFVGILSGDVHDDTNRIKPNHLGSETTQSFDSLLAHEPLGVLFSAHCQQIHEATGVFHL